MLRVRSSRHCAAALAAASIIALVSGCGGVDDAPSTPGIPVQMSLTAASASSTSVILRWSGLSGAPTRYEVYMNGTFYASAYPSNASSTSEAVRISSLTPATNYCFVVYAVYFPLGVGARSNEACAETPPA